MFDTNSIDNSKFDSYKGNIFIGKGLSIKTKIFRYTSFTNLLTILEEGKLFINLRSNFSDRREKGEFYNSKLLFSRFSVANEKTDEETLKEWSYKDAQIRAACKLPTSCWTTKAEEDFLMWSAYAKNEDGVRIETTIEKLIGSPIFFEGILYCDNIKYGKEKPLYEVGESMFYKTNFYKGEEEFRFYVIEKNIKMNSVFLDVNPLEMIQEIILSPFLPIKIAKVKIEMLQEKYRFLNDKIRISNIMEYKK